MSIIIVFIAIVAAAALLKCVCPKPAERNKHPSTPKRSQKKLVCPGAPGPIKRVVRHAAPRSLVFYDSE